MAEDGATGNYDGEVGGWGVGVGLGWMSYPAAMASGLAGTAAVRRSRGSLLLTASPSKAKRSSFMKPRKAARSSAPLLRYENDTNQTNNTAMCVWQPESWETGSDCIDFNSPSMKLIFIACEWANRFSIYWVWIITQFIKSLNNSISHQSIKVSARNLSDKVQPNGMITEGKPSRHRGRRICWIAGTRSSRKRTDSCGKRCRWDPWKASMPRPIHRWPGGSWDLGSYRAAAGGARAFGSAPIRPPRHRPPGRACCRSANHRRRWGGCTVSRPRLREWSARCPAAYPPSSCSSTPTWRCFLKLVQNQTNKQKTRLNLCQSFYWLHPILQTIWLAFAFFCPPLPQPLPIRHFPAPLINNYQLQVLGSDRFHFEPS